VADDVLQEFFVKLFRAAPEPSSRPRAYMYRMARNLAIDAVRKQVDHLEFEDAAAILPVAYDDIPLRLDIEAALNALPQTEGQIVGLHINGGLTFKEIAAVMDIPIGTALWRYHKAIKQLRKSLSGG
jgi:RNA polymerase sigma-70 factor (ECF subfamily)